MDFGSEFVYDYETSDDEYIPEQEFERGIQLNTFDNEEPIERAKSCPNSTMKDLSLPLQMPTDASIIEWDDILNTRPKAPAFGMSPGYSDIQRDGKPTLKELQLLKGIFGEVVKIIDATAPTWEQVATALEFEAMAIERIGRDKRNNCKAASRQMYLEWLNGESGSQCMQVTWGTLIGCLKDTDMSAIAEDIESVIDNGMKTPVHPPPTPPPCVVPKKKYKSRVSTAPVDGRKNLMKVMKKASKRGGTRKKATQGKGIKGRKMDTNIVAVKFGSLGIPHDVHTGDVVYCLNTKCGAVLSHISKVTKENESKMVWQCEFCRTSNEVDIHYHEIPTKDEVTYLLRPSLAAPDSDLHTASSRMEDSILVFCIDISGSMCVATEVARKMSLKSDKKIRSLSLEHKADISTQFLPHQRKNVSYISRLQSVQAAVHKQLVNLAGSHPFNRVALITFNSEVTVVGDGKTEDVVVAGDKLSNIATLLKIGKDLSIPSRITDSFQSLKTKLSDLEEEGQTALGPALLLSILLAGQKHGSQVIVCTDGLANVGLGCLDGDDVQHTKFYDGLGDIAIRERVTVSLVTIKGEECQVMKLGQLARSTGGNVIRVDPSSVATEFSNIVSNPIIATNVNCKVNLHNRLYCRTEEDVENVLYVKIGNVTTETEFSFEYGVRKVSQSDKEDVTEASGFMSSQPPTDLEVQDSLPFQLQTEYTTIDGATYLRVNTIVKPVTKERGMAENKMDVLVVGQHGLRTSAKFASEGKFYEARAGAIISHNLLKRSGDEGTPHYKEVMKSLGPFEKALRENDIATSTDQELVQGNSSVHQDASQADRPSSVSAYYEAYISSHGQCRDDKEVLSPSFNLLTQPRCNPGTATPGSKIVSIRTPPKVAFKQKSGSPDKVATAIHAVSPLASPRPCVLPRPHI